MSLQNLYLHFPFLHISVYLPSVSQRDKEKSPAQDSFSLRVLITNLGARSSLWAVLLCSFSSLPPDRDLSGPGDFHGKASLQESSVCCLLATNQDLLCILDSNPSLNLMYERGNMLAPCKLQRGLRAIFTP